jgi:hypothetical protein
VKSVMPGMTRRDFMGVVRTHGRPFNTATGYGVPRWSWFMT